jgi:hypothetical protein
MAVEQMNPEPTDVHTDDEEHAWMDQMFRRVAAGWNYWEDAATGKPLDARGSEVLTLHVERMRRAADRVYEDLRMKLATAPPPPAPVPSYPDRVARWTLSPAYALFGGPCLAGIITAAATGTGAGVGVYLLLAVAIRAGAARGRAPASAHVHGHLAHVRGGHDGGGRGGTHRGELHRLGHRLPSLGWRVYARTAREPDCALRWPGTQLSSRWSGSCRH